MSEEVKELLDKLGSMEDAPLIWINQRVENLITENKQLKDRINKAIEYVNNHIHQETFTGYMDSYELKKLLSLLKGDKE